MAIPNEPLTRAEQFLNRIATGEGTIPDEPLTRIEQYLDYIAKNGSGGGGSGVDNVARQSIGTLSNLNTEDKSNLVAAINEVLQTAEEDVQSVLPTDTASGAIASFPDGADDAAVKSLVATIKPAQDLHGYDSPWPAGGGKNKIYFVPYSANDYYVFSNRLNPIINTVNQTITLTCAGQGQTVLLYKHNFAPNTYTISYNTDRTYYNRRVIVRCFDANENVLTGDDISVTNGTWLAYYNGFYLTGGGPTYTFTVPNTVDHFWIGLGVNGDTQDDTVVFSKIQLEVGSSATSYAPYSNICPITGFTGCKVSRAGKNILPTAEAVTVAANQIKYSLIGSVTLKANQAYTFSCKQTGTPTEQSRNCFAVGTTTNMWEPPATFGTNAVTIPKFTFTPTETRTYYLFIWTQGVNVDVTYSNFQCELGSTATDYEPYQGDTYNIAFPSEAGTVYGGTLDVANGVLTVDSAIVDMGALDWMYYSAQQRMVAQINSAKPSGANFGFDGACSVYKVVTDVGYQYVPDKSIIIGNNFISNRYAAMVVHDEDYTDAATFKTAVSGQTLVFPIKNPVTYQLTPTEVKTLLGVNSIWADTGDVAVDYRADTGLYIQKLTGSTEEDMIADAPIASGKYFLVGNTLYLSTAAIAAGATLTPGTNCVKTNLAEALNALNS